MRPEVVLSRPDSRDFRSGFVIGPSNEAETLKSIGARARVRQIGAAASQHVALHHALADRVVDIKRAYGWTSGRSGASIGGPDTR